MHQKYESTKSHNLKSKKQFGKDSPLSFVKIYQCLSSCGCNSALLLMFNRFLRTFNFFMISHFPLNQANPFICPAPPAVPHNSLTWVNVLAHCLPINFTYIQLQLIFNHQSIFFACFMRFNFTGKHRK